MSTPRRLPIIGAALAIALAAAMPAAVEAARTIVVSQASVAYPHVSSIQEAVNAANPGDWILIDAGTYNEAVYITTPNLHLRGMDRNGVIVDGQHQTGNGIEVWKANGVTIENLTVRDFDRATLDGEDGNEIWWNGGDGSGLIGLTGWKGQYLTTYDTGLLGGYGIFASNSVKGLLDNVYASGFNDSGLYIGACRDCRAKVKHALVENNSLGYSGTNSGGHLVVQDSVFQHNSNGVGPNSLNNDDLPPPQDGACSSGLNTSATPTFSGTHIRRCTVFKHNVVDHNDNFTTPGNSTTISIPWGNGFVLIGTYADLIEHNTITNNPSSGLLGFENPDPFPPTVDTIYFQLSGNKIYRNTFSNNGVGNPDPHAGDVTLADLAGFFGEPAGSVNNCFAGNAFTTSYPANLETTWSCRRPTTPIVGADALFYILSLQAASQARTSVPQPVPPPQPTMPSPCSGVPANPLCA